MTDIDMVLRNNNIVASFDDAAKAANAMAASGYFQDAKQAAQCLVKILAGKEMGLGPFASMTGIHIIQGKPAIGANLIAGAIKASGKYNYKMSEFTDTAVEIAILENGQDVGHSRFTMMDADAAGITTSNQNWKRYPRNMLFSRAISNAARWYCPDIFSGTPVYTPDEMGAVVDADGNAVIDITPTPTVPVPTKPREAPVERVRPYKAEVLKEKLAARIATFAGKQASTTDNFAVKTSLDMCFSTDQESCRRQVTSYLVGKTSTKDMTDPELLGLKAWLAPRQDSDGLWHVDDISAQEARAVLGQAQIDAGQQSMDLVELGG